MNVYKVSYLELQFQLLQLMIEIIDSDINCLFLINQFIKTAYF